MEGAALQAPLVVEERLVREEEKRSVALRPECRPRKRVGRVALGLAVVAPESEVALEAPQKQALPLEGPYTIQALFRLACAIPVASATDSPCICPIRILHSEASQPLLQPSFAVLLKS